MILYLDPRSNRTPGSVFGPPLKYLDPPNKHPRNALVGQFAVFLGRQCESVNLR